MFVSLVCMLTGASGEVKKWRPAGADRGFTFLRYNLTVAYHRTNLLVRYGRWSASPNGGSLESLGYKQGYRVDVDVPEHTWAEAVRFHHILIFNTGHWWWAPSKFDPVQSPMLFFENGVPVIPPIPPPLGMDKALKFMISYVEKAASTNTIKFFRTQSPRHFENGDWNKGGSCPRVEPLSPDKAEELFSLENNGTNVEARLVNQHLFKALEGTSFHVLNITRMSEFRADAHPSTTGGKKHVDCMHWCLPGLTDTWNDLFAALLDSL
ncbi:protein trichome birefringence-like 13 [Ananas comosus]|uniref:Protein trichome birefringence-like 13 n=1 Tax=Ananas comosus TaxID=4615 RepID=A0A6P5FHU2_ANACO|nr:protein trichome birefringence-like 13 [Ananas comosus]